MPAQEVLACKCKVHFSPFLFTTSGLILSVLAHGPNPVTVLVQDKRHRRHERGDDGHNRQRPVRAQVVVHLDRGRRQRAGDDVARKGHEA